MTEQSTAGTSGSMKWLAIGAVVVILLPVAAIVGLIILVGSVIGGGMNEGDSSASGGMERCREQMEQTGSGGGSEVEIPEEYEEAVADAAASSGFSVDLVAALIEHESWGWQEDIESNAGAVGLGQFTEEAWADWGTGDPDDRTDPLLSIEAVGEYLAYLDDYFQDWDADEEEHIKLVLAGYNAGPGAVDDYDGQPPYEETRDHYAAITAAANGSYTEECENEARLPNGEGVTVVADGDDDYPWREPPTCALPECGNYEADTAGHALRQCTSFVMWRLNQQVGYTADDAAAGKPMPIRGTSLGIGYPGSAADWAETFTEAPGVEFHTSTPQPGDIAWWGLNDIGGGYGHVGWVSEVNGDEVTVEHYNYGPRNEYSVSTEQVDEVPGYIRVSPDELPTD